MKAWLILVVALAELAQVLAAAEFEFVVIGDTRPRFESENFRAFESLIPVINRQHPACVVNVGDLIYGYGPRSKAKQWDGYERVIKGFQVPYYQLPGNHDTHSRSARRLYGQRFGRFFQSFDYSDCHFVLLDNTEAQRWGYLGPAQVAWLKKDLQQTTARSVFVFMHFPTWEPERLSPRYYEFWQQTLHPLFKESRVRAVFGGHFHAYGPTREIDGIQYFITGGGGAELLPEYKKSGGEHHFVKVKVSGESFQVRVVTEHGELSDPEADIMGGFIFADKYSSRVGISRSAQDLRQGVPFSITVQNPYSEHLIGRAKWAWDTNLFQVEPTVMKVDIPAGGSQQESFVLKALKEAVSLTSAPRLDFDVKSGSRRHRFYREILFVQPWKAVYRARTPTLASPSGDWKEVPALNPYPDLKTGFALRAWNDAKNLLLAVTVPTATAEAKEECGWADDLQLGFAQRRNQTDFGGDFLRLGCAAERGTVLNRLAGAKTGRAVPGIKSVAKTVGQQTVFELTIPLRLLHSAQATRQEPLILSLSFPVDGARPEAEEPAEPAADSFAYQVRYGSGLLAPIHFVELTLGRKR